MNIGELIEKGESETMEFKPSLSQIKDIVETASVFSNTKGGLIVIGVNDERRHIGIDIGNKTIENLANKIKQNTDPKIYPSISVEDITGKNVIVVEVKESKSDLFLLLIGFTKELGRAIIEFQVMKLGKWLWKERKFTGTNRFAKELF